MTDTLSHRYHHASHLCIIVPPAPSLFLRSLPCHHHVGPLRNWRVGPRIWWSTSQCHSPISLSVASCKGCSPNSLLLPRIILCGAPPTTGWKNISNPSLSHPPPPVLPLPLHSFPFSPPPPPSPTLLIVIAHSSSLLPLLVFVLSSICRHSLVCFFNFFPVCFFLRPKLLKQVGS